MVQQRGSPEASTEEVNDVEARAEVQARPWVIFHFGWRHARHSLFLGLRQHAPWSLMCALAKDFGI